MIESIPLFTEAFARKGELFTGLQKLHSLGIRVDSVLPEHISMIPRDLLPDFSLSDFRGRVLHATGKAVPEDAAIWLYQNRRELIAFLHPDHNPSEYNLLTKKQQRAVCTLLLNTFAPLPITKRKRGGRTRLPTTYQLKHVFEKCGGFYISHGQMKGAFQILEYPILNLNEIYWQPLIERKQPCPHLMQQGWGNSANTMPGLCRKKPDVLTGVCAYHRRKGDRDPSYRPNVIGRFD